MPILKSLHWLPVSFHIDFKMILVVYKALHGLAPGYLSEMLLIYEAERPQILCCFALNCPKEQD
ncbi:hypothetical protein LDENG_00191150 [Lucifuga dentata]|nr:hypothetical protein LDENG_00191150 [Lucifuga dentata]